MAAQRDCSLLLTFFLVGAVSLDVKMSLTIGKKVLWWKMKEHAQAVGYLHYLSSPSLS